jgi:hypothetical protein
MASPRYARLMISLRAVTEAMREQNHKLAKELAAGWVLLAKRPSTPADTKDRFAGAEADKVYIHRVVARL